MIQGRLIGLGQNKIPTLCFYKAQMFGLKVPLLARAKIEILQNVHKILINRLLLKKVRFLSKKCKIGTSTVRKWEKLTKK